MFGLLALLNTGCYAHADRAGIGMEMNVQVHDVRWHYDHDNDEGWRRHHSWRKYEWEHKEDKWRHDHPWHDDDNDGR